MHFWQKQKPSHEQAMDWFKANMVPGQSIIVHARQPVHYPGGTGHFIPALYNWGEEELARTCTKWLMSIQLPDGADGVAYIFDTAQIMRGLCAVLGDVDGTEDTLRCASGRMLTLVELTGDNRTAQIFDLSTQSPRDLDLLPATAFEDVAAADFNNAMDVDVFALASGDIGQQETNRNGIGAVVHVTAGGVHNRGRNHSCLDFGLAKDAQIEKITVHWPSGVAQVLSGMKTDQVIRIKEERQPSPRECSNG